MRNSNLKKILLLLGIIGAFLMVHQSTAQAQNNILQSNNVVQNGDFETGSTSPWEYISSGGNFSVVNYNGSLQGHLYSGGQIEQSVKILDNKQQYSFSMDYDQVYSGYMARVTLTAYDAGDQSLGVVYTDYSQSSTPGSFESGPLTLPEGTDHIGINIYGSINGDLYVDNVVLGTCQP